MRPYQKHKTELNWLQWVAPLMYRDRSQAQPPFGLFFHVLRARSFALRLDSPESRMFPLLESALVPRSAFLPLTTSPDRLRYVPSDPWRASKDAEKVVVTQ